VVEKHTRLLQICHPFLLPFLVELVNNKNDFTSSERGIGGFGSTGVVGAI
jgi:dUTPase